jgi:putative oxidoreductase
MVVGIDNRGVVMNEQARLVFPGLAPFYERVTPYVYPMVRFTVGALLVPHGWTKLMRGAEAFAASPSIKGLALAPSLDLPAAWFIILLELLGGICIALGLFTRVIAAALAIEFAIITFVAHWPLGFFWTARGFEYPLMWGIMFFAIALLGGGSLSVDRHILKREV